MKRSLEYRSKSPRTSSMSFIIETYVCVCVWGPFQLQYISSLCIEHLPKSPPRKIFKCSIEMNISYVRTYIHTYIHTYSRVHIYVCISSVCIYYYYYYYIITSPTEITDDAPVSPCLSSSSSSFFLCTILLFIFFLAFFPIVMSCV